jgi:hypothetical protein
MTGVASTITKSGVASTIHNRSAILEVLDLMVTLFILHDPGVTQTKPSKLASSF